MLAEMGGLEQTLGMPNGSSVARTRQSTAQPKSAAQQHFYSTLARQDDLDDFVKLESDMTFEQAKQLIHCHILDLDV